MFSWPIIVAFLFELILTQLYIERVFNFLENIYFSFILLLPVFIIETQTLKVFYLKTVYIFIVLMLFLETGYYYIFNSKFNPSSLFIVSETNLNEAKEFLLFYLNKKLLVFLFLLLVLLIHFFLNIKNFTNKIFSIQRKFFAIFLFLCLSTLLILVSFSRRENLPFVLAKSFYDLKKDSYFDDQKNYGDAFGPFTENLNSNLNDTYIIVIGESISKRHLNIYGYERNTTPLLNKLQDEILIYDDVITPNAFTIEALGKALTSKKVDGSIVQLLNKAGFKTFWLSNQNPIGIYESLISKIAKASNTKHFLTTARFDKNIIYDEELIVELEAALKDNNDRKVIFIHLQGAHFDYKYRYPKKYNYFNDKPKSKYTINEETDHVINTYDNAILYHDFIVSSIINKVKTKNISSAILYFSDHGEEVFDTMEFSGHNDDIGSLPMFEIPFVLWRSESFQEKYNFEIDLDRPYTTDDLFHSIADLCGIKNSSHVDFEKSIFNEDFKKRKRIILNNKDYDSILSIDKMMN
ncbi:MAG: sulfatase-like hydrolase/transferase, partial [Flavobacteriaceae bacterium]